MSNDHWPGFSPDDASSRGPARTGRARSPDLLERWAPLAEEIYQRSVNRALPFPLTNCATPGRHFLGFDPQGQARQGVNFASADHLNLTSHVRVIAAAAAALDQFGPHSASTLERTGQSATAAALEAEIAAFAGFAEATLFPSGWSAGFAAVRTLVQPGDHVLAPEMVQGGIVEGMAASGARIHRFCGSGADGLAKRLGEVRAGDPQAGLLLVVESLSGVESRFVDLAALQHLCLHHRATLLLDVSPDFGAIGPKGLGALELQRMVGSVDVIVGDLSRVFAANGGFVCSNHLALRSALRHGLPASCAMAALSPQQVAAAAEALAIVTSDEGAERRTRLMANVLRLRQSLTCAGLQPLGVAGPMVLVPAGSAMSAHQATVALQDAGAFAQLLEAPFLHAGPSLWQFQVMADHTGADIDTLIAALVGLRTGHPAFQPHHDPP